MLLPTGTMEGHGVANNGADNTAPVGPGPRHGAPSLNALVAPVVPYGVTVSESAYRAFIADVLAGLARQGFRNLIVVNGHGGPQTAIFNEVAEATGRAPRPPQGAWSAYPFPSPIILYQPGQGYVKFDPPKADAYFRAVTDKMTALVRDTIEKWDRAGIFAQPGPGGPASGRKRRP